MGVNIQDDDIDDTLAEDEEVCDFCSDPRVTRRLAARDVKIGQVAEVFDGPVIADVGSRGAWATCEPCYTFIVSNNREALLDRAVDRLVQSEVGAAFRDLLPIDEKPMMRTMIRAAHDAYFKARKV